MRNDETETKATTRTRWCGWCGRPIPGPHPATGRPRLYCRTGGCRTRAAEHRREEARTLAAILAAERAILGKPDEPIVPPPASGSARAESPGRPQPREEAPAEVPRPARPVAGGEDVPLW